MTRVLLFEGPRAAKRFQLLWIAISSGGDGKGDRVPATIRKEARLQDAFEAVSEPVATTSPNEPDRTLRNGPDPHMATIPQEDFDLLQSYTEKTPWSPRVSRDVVDLWDFLSSCPKQE